MQIKLQKTKLASLLADVEQQQKILDEKVYQLYGLK